MRNNWPDGRVVWYIKRAANVFLRKDKMIDNELHLAA